MEEFISYLQENLALFIVLIVLAVLIVAAIVAIAVIAAKKNKKKKAALNEMSGDGSGAEDERSDGTEDQTQTEAETVGKISTEQPTATEQKADESSQTAADDAAESEEAPQAGDPDLAKTEKPAQADATEEDAEAKRENGAQAAERKPKRTAKPAAKQPEDPLKPTDKDGKTAEESPAGKRSYGGKWTILPTDYGTYRFELLASNGERMLGSNDYSSLNGAKNGIETYKANIAAGNFRIVSTKGGNFIFHLLNKNGQMLSVGETYKNRSRCESAVESTKRFAATAALILPAEIPAAEQENEQESGILNAEPAETVDIKAEPVKTEPVVKKNNFYDGKWVVYPTDYDTFRFELRASNGEKMLGSNDYSSLNGARNGIETYKANIAAGNFRIVCTKAGDYLFHLLNKNRQMLAVGETYKTRSSCENAVESTKRFAATACVETPEEE